MGKGKKRRHQPLAVEVRYCHSLNPIRLHDGRFLPPIPSLTRRLLRYYVPSSPHHPTIAPSQLDEDAREQREMEVKRKRMLRRRTEGQGDDDDRGGEEEAAAAAAVLGGEGDGQVGLLDGSEGTI